MYIPKILIIRFLFFIFEFKFTVSYNIKLTSYFSLAFFDSLELDTMVDACTVVVTTVMNTKEVNMVLRVRTVITKLKHYDNST